MSATTLALVAALSLGASAIAAQAAPLAPLTPNQHSPAIVKVAGVCGYGWHRTRFGDCAPNRYRMHRVRPYDDYIEEWDEYDSY